MMKKCKTAVIMAAGLGSRFGKMTESMPKGFIEVGGTSMIERSLRTLIAAGIERIVIGTGYKSETYEALKTRYPQIETCHSPRYAETNSMYTLWTMRHLIGDDDFLLLESDLVFELRALTTLLDDAHPDIMLVSPVTKFQDQYYVAVDAQGNLSNCSTDETALDYGGELVGIHKLSYAFYKAMCASYATLVDAQPKLGYEYQLITMSNSGHPLYVKVVDGLQWYEIDDENDRRYAEEHIIPQL